MGEREDWRREKGGAKGTAGVRKKKKSQKGDAEPMDPPQKKISVAHRAGGAEGAET